MLYRPEEVEAWIEASEVVPKPEDSTRNRKLGGRPQSRRGNHEAGHQFEPQLPARNGRKSLPPSPKSILRNRAQRA